MSQALDRRTDLAPPSPTVCDLFNPQPQTWVRLRDRPTPYSDDEALLLCQTSQGKWIAWLGGYGQIELDRSQFLRAS